MGEAFPNVDVARDSAHELTKIYMEMLERGEINDLFIGECLAGQIAVGEIDEDTAEAVLENLGIDEVTED